MNGADGRQELVNADPASQALPLTVTFDGIIEGTVADRRALALAIRALAALPAPGFEAEFEGNGCSLMVDDAVHSGAAFTPDHWARLRGRLERVIAGFDQQEEIASTLRCSERFAHQIRETLFVVDRSGLQLVSRNRDADEREEAIGSPGDDVQSPLERGFQRRSALVILCLFLLAGALVVWHEGIVYRLFPAGSASIRIVSGDFSDLLAVETRQSWGSYRITLSRGPRFPATSDDLAQRLSTATTLGARAASNLVAEGGDIFLVLESGSGKSLATVEVSLRPLLASPQAHATCTLPGEARASSIRIALAKPESDE